MAMRFDENDDETIVAEINITPLTDVFLVLLIIFMISSSAMLEGGLNVKLPTAKSSALTQTVTGKPVYVTVDANGGINVNSKDAGPDNLIEVLRGELNQTQERTVIIRGDESIFLGNAVRIMDAARAAGADKIAIATQPPK
ncbi:MAG: biopolymer transporter ExbD [Bdellovibrionales bacterium]|nr:biopolymer transporter ExbD [Bdellovibrionales bacterium]